MHGDYELKDSRGCNVITYNKWSKYDSSYVHHTSAM